MHPDKKGKTTLNYIETITSTGTPNSSESDMVVPLQAITRAQARAIAEKGKRKVEEVKETEATPPRENTKKSKETWKQRRARRAASKKRQAEKEQAAVHETTQQNLEQQPEKSQKDIPNVTTQP